MASGTVEEAWLTFFRKKSGLNDPGQEATDPALEPLFVDADQNKRKSHSRAFLFAGR